MRNKLRSRRGFTLSELLAALAILALLSTALAVGIPTVLSVYRQVTLHSEASVLCGTLTAALADELRQAASPDEADDTFYRDGFGGRIKVGSQDGRVRLGSRELLSDSSYTSGLRASALADYDGGLFHVAVDVTGSEGQALASAEFEVAPLNP